MTIQKIRHYHYVSASLTSSGQPEDAEFKLIAQAGYQVVINLAMPNSQHAIPEEGNLVSSLKMSYIHIPVPFEAPQVSHLQQFIKLLDAFADQKIWIHCAYNYRVSAFLYQYKRVVLHETSQQAMSVLFPGWQPDPVWQAFMAIPIEHILEVSVHN